MELRCIPPIFFPGLGGLLWRSVEKAVFRTVPADGGVLRSANPGSTDRGRICVVFKRGIWGLSALGYAPETIFLKGLAMGKIDELLSGPTAGNTEWSAALRSWINRLDAMEREFAPCDTARFGSLPSRVRYIDNVMAKYPDCFTAPPIPEG
jgi:Family of unknown function (DUF6058)